ncbi:DUF2500 domain-containing protein [Defluviitalea phaphyphila]|uniref:DUF2500 domain-containing protein n=1 Tax=Defluviitalea phaphyphila TaxID=1473580 RepID=UPI00073016A5|nr:DUF2500 domain-containing protein [Defluviitalea phaphyphila]
MPYHNNFYNFTGLLFNIVPIFIFIVFFIIIIMFIFTMIKGVKQWNYNNHQPILIVDAKIVSKRTKVSSSSIHRNHHGIGHHHSRTYYYITFEFESGSRMEFNVDGQEFGLLAEGDTGKLKFQGSRYLSFERF